ncbi:MAG TPA: YggS family pyridoxal phosphate-dependent enzyme [Steroidobacteraceae bacterium]|nr:YggS family pyridoxal phosphate-dependent enzyme [Steroidobacteraceae bacterium]
MLTAPQNPSPGLARVRERIARAAREACRDPASVTLIGVAKSQPAESITTIVDGGLADLGENYLQEAEEHAAALAGRPVRWHFIGALQSNKTRPVAERFDWVHTVDRLKIAERLSAQRPAGLPPLAVCVQVNLAGEASKSGVAPAELPALAQAVARLPRLALRGLMALPPEEQEVARQRHWFRELRLMRDALVQRGLALDTLSMGMSGDFEAAIAEGATHLRIGSALFGPRPPPPSR